MARRDERAARGMTLVVALLAPLLTTAVATSGAGAGTEADTLRNPPPFVRAWSAPTPRDLSVGPDGNIYLIGQSDRSLRVHEPDGTLLRQWQTMDPGTDEWLLPKAVATAPSGDVYVTTAEDRVKRFSNTGTLLTEWGAQGNDPGEFRSPNGIAVSPSGNVFVVDGSGRLQEFTADGTFVRVVTDGLGDPQSVELAADGSVYVSTRSEVRKFTPAGDRVDGWTLDSYGRSLLTYPGDLAVDPAGDVYVREGNVQPPYSLPVTRIAAVDADGTLLTRWGRHGTALGQFEGAALDFAADGTLFVADFGNDRVQVFAPVPQPDLRIHGPDQRGAAGNGIYNATGAFQRRIVEADAGDTITFEVRLENDAPIADEILVHGAATSGGFVTRYRVDGADVTAAVTDGTYSSGSLDPDEHVQLDIEVTVDAAQEAAAALDGTLTASSSTASDRLDAVGFTVRACTGGCVPSTPPARQHAYVADPATDTVVPIDLSTNTPGVPIPVGDGPIDVAITPDGATVYVANGDDGTLTPIDTRTSRAGPAITVGGHPRDLAIAPDGQTAIVTAEDAVHRVDLVTREVTLLASIGYSGSPVVVSQDGETAYVGVEGGVQPIDLATSTVGTPIPVDYGVLALANDPQGSAMYAVQDQSRPGTGWSLLGINVNTGAYEGGIFAGYYPSSVAVTPDGAIALVTSSDSEELRLTDTRTWRGLAPISVGNRPIDVAVTPDGTGAYVTNFDDGTVTPVDLVTRTAGTPIRVGGNPYGIAVTPNPALTPPAGPARPVAATPTFTG